MWWSLILIWACAGNPGSPVRVLDTDPQAAGCDENHWGYTAPMFDFHSKLECDTAGMNATKQPPNVYMTWRCVVDREKKGWINE